MKKGLVIISCMFSGLAVYSQTGIGTKNVDPSALMELQSTSKGFLPPRVQLKSGTDITTIVAPAKGLTVYHTGIAGMAEGLYVNLGTPTSATWVSTSGGNWGLTGNAGTLPANNFIGTTDLADFITRTNNTERMRITGAGNVGIGTNAPGTTLDVNGAITNRETAIAVAGNAVTVPNNISQVMLTGLASANIAVTVPAAPNSGQRLIIYNNTDGGFPALLNNIPVPAAQAMEFVFSNGNWRGTNGGATAITPNTFWSNNGNTGTNASTNFIGTTDNIDFITRTNNTEKLRVTGAGNLGIGTNAPGTTLDVNGAITNRETAIAVASNAVTIPVNVSQVQLTGATGNVAITVPGAPNNGQRLIIYNNTSSGYSAILNGVTVRNGQAVEFIYTTGGWKSTDNGISTTGAPNEWHSTGNAGTTAATNFIGTTDGVDFITKTSGTERMRVSAAGNVGIGTPLPKSRLDLGNTIGTTITDVGGKKLALYNDALGDDFYGLGISNVTLQFHASSTKTEAPGMVLNASGNVGIGDTNPTTRFGVVDGVTTNQYQGIASFTSSSLTAGVGIGYNGIQAIGTNANNDLYLNGKGTGNILLQAAGGATGNLGIGTATPGTTLDVNGAITNRETAVAVAANAATIPANTSQVQLTGAATANIAVTAPAAPNAGQRLIIYNNTTNGFPAVLNGIPVPMGQAMEFAFSGGNWRGTNGGAVAGNLTWGINGNAGTLPSTNFIGTTNNVDFVTRTSNAERMRITAAGNVGISTTTPNSILDLGTTIGANATDVLGKKLALYNNAAGNDFYGIGVSSGLLQFYASATPAKAPGMVLGAGGNVGIGTAGPTEKFTVVSDLNSLAQQYQGIGSFLAQNLTSGVGIGWQGIQAIGSNANSDLYLNGKGTGNILLQAANGATGKVGIGTATPVAQLDVVGGGSTIGLRNAGIGTWDNLWFNIDPNGSFASINASGAESGLQFRVGSNAVGTYGDGGQTLTTVATMLSSGRMGIGTTTPGETLTVNGTAAKTGGGSWAVPSDRRLKKDIHPFTDGLKQVLQIKPVFFQYNGKGGINPSKKEEIGIIAQEMQQIAPYTITQTDRKIDDSGKGALQFDRVDAVTYMLVNGMKEQQSQIETQKLENSELKKQLAAQQEILSNLLKKVASLEQAISTKK